MKPIFWIDNFSHNLINSGELKEMIKHNNITGLTSNPTILANAIKNDNYYKQKLFELSRLSKAAKYDELVFPDIAKACDLFLPIYKSSKHTTGFVSLELDPKYTFNVEESINSACAIWNTIDRPNLMIKVPASNEGITVMEELIKRGINVNVTLIFSIAQVKSVWSAYINAIQHRASRNLPLNVRAVASFFISRLDTIADPMLSKELQGKSASSLALVAYQEYSKLFSTSIWEDLETKGAIPQTLLWASVGVKNPEYSIDKYIRELNLSDTIFTIPPSLINNVKHDHIDKNHINNAQHTLDLVDAKLKEKDSSIDELTAQLFNDAVTSFQKSFTELIEIL
jgi:transaldolase